MKGSTCRAYVRQRTAAASTARRELDVLQAALNHAHAEGLLVHPIKVTLPKVGKVRERWLTRDKAAKLIRHASPHVRRFILAFALHRGPGRGGARSDVARRGSRRRADRVPG